MQLTIRTVFLTVHACIVNLELWARAIAAVRNAGQNACALTRIRAFRVVSVC